LWPAAGGVFKTDGIIVGFQYPLTVVFFDLSDFAIIDANLIAVGYRQVPLVAFRGRKLNRPLRGRFFVGMSGKLFISCASCKSTK
jgi:hypothetical protein